MTMDLEPHLGPSQLNAIEPDAVIPLIRARAGKASNTKSFAWATGSRLAQALLQFASSAVLSRLLFPSQFGLFAIVQSVTLFANLFTDLGLGAAVVHTRHPTTRLLSTTFWINALSGLVLACMAYGLGLGLAAIYHRPALVGLMVIAGLNFVFDLGIVHNAILERSMHFKQIAKIETLSTLIGIVISIACAGAGLGAASLVLGPLSATISLSIFLWVVVPWRPRLRADRESASEVVTYGRGLLGFNAANYWSRNADTLLLGRFTTVTQLGLYDRAYTLMTVPIFQMNAVLNRVLFPAMTRHRDDPPRVVAQWQLATKLTILGALPVSLICVTAGPSLIDALYGPRWRGAGVILELLSGAAFAQLVPATCGAVYQAMGRTAALFKQGLLLSSTTVIAIVIGLHWGAEGVAAAILVRTWLVFWVPIRGVCRILGIRSRTVYASLVGLSASGIAFAAVSILIREIATPLPLPTRFIVQGIAGMVAMLCTLRLTDRELFNQSAYYTQRARARLPWAKKPGEPRTSEGTL